jgi:hypothetical protein
MAYVEMSTHRMKVMNNSRMMFIFSEDLGKSILKKETKSGWLIRNILLKIAKSEQTKNCMSTENSKKFSMFFSKDEVFVIETLEFKIILVSCLKSKHLPHPV